MSQHYNAFISYGRADSKAFATKLYNDLTAADWKIWFDQNDIPLGVDFQNQIDHGIEKADNFLFIIAPHSVNSPYCLKEIELAVKYKKRIIPLLHVEEITYETWQKRNPDKTADDWKKYREQGRHSSFPNMHPEIGRINWVYFQENINNYDKSLTDLIGLFHRQEDYVSQHTQFLVKALEWERNQKQTPYLLVGQQRQAAEKWLKVEFNQEQPPCHPTDLQCELICESIKNANNLMTQVFLSYSTQNRWKMEKVRNSLMRQGITVWTNITDIKTGSEFKQSINRGIEGADNLVYLLSPDALHSSYCQQELAHALSLNKRVIYLLIEPTDLELVPAEIQDFQYIDLTASESEPEYQVAVAELIKELRENEVYYSQHKVLLVKALKWQEQNRNPSVLLRGYNLERYQSWLQVARGNSLHGPTDLQVEFIAESAKQLQDLALDVFISYSRANSDFARGLNEALQTQGKTTWFDQESIATGTDFQTEIYRGIEQSDNFLFIISPGAVNSPYCADEVEYARGLNKRFVTVLHRPVNTAELHPELAKVQWLDFNRHGGDFYTNFSELVRALDTDREYMREHTKKSQRAREWQRQTQSHDLLLRGRELVRGYEWLSSAEKENKQPPVTADVKEFILKSKAEAERLQNAAKRIKNIIAGLSLGAIALLSGLSIYAWWHKEVAQRERHLALAGQLAAESQSMRARYRGLYQGSVLLAIESMNKFQELNAPAVTADRALRGGLLMPDFFLEMQHDAPVRVVAFSRDGKYIATASDDKTARLWDAVTGKEIATFGDDFGINTLALSGDGKKIAAASDNTVWVWDVATREEIAKFNHDRQINALALSGDGKTIAIARDDKTARVWDASTGKEIVTLDRDRQVWTVAFSPDGKYIATGGQDKAVRVWDVARTSEISRLEHDGWVRAVAFSGNGKKIVTASDDKTARVWDAATGLEIVRLQHDARVNAVAFSANGQKIATGSADNTAGVWDASTGREIARLNHNGSVNAVAFNADGKKIATGSDDNTAEVWSAVAKQEVLRFGHAEAVNAVAFSRDGQYIASGSDDSTARVWDASTGKELAKFQHQGWVWAVAFSSDRQYVATGSWDNTGRMWNATNGEEIHRFNHSGRVWAVAFSDDGKYIATASEDRTVRLWDTATGKELGLIWHNEAVWAVAFSRDGKYVASGSDDHTARVWDVATGKELAKLQHDALVKAVAFSADGKYIATASADRTVRVWDAATGKELARGRHDAPVNAVAFNSDGKYIVTGSTDKTARVWDWATEEERIWLSYNTPVRSVAFSADDKYIIIASDDKVVRKDLFDFKDLKAQVCLRLRRNLTANEWERYMKQELYEYHKTCEALPVNPSLIAEVRKLARKDKVEEAQKLLGALLKLDSLLDSIPNTKEIERDPKVAVEWFQAEVKLEQAVRLAGQGDIQEAIALFQELQELHPALDLNPDTKDITDKNPEAVARLLAAQGKVSEGAQLAAKQGKIYEAIAAFQEAQELHPGIDLNPYTTKDIIETDPEAVARQLATYQQE